MTTARAERALTDKQERFAQYRSEDMDKVTAYKQAGYRWEDTLKGRHWASRYIYSLSKHAGIVKRISELTQERKEKAEDIREIGVDWVRSKHREYMKLCIAKQDYANATRNLELFGKTYGVYRDRLTVDVDELREFSEAQRIDAKRIATILLESQPIDAQLELPEPLNAEEIACAGDVGVDEVLVEGEERTVPRDESIEEAIKLKQGEIQAGSSLHTIKRMFSKEPTNTLPNVNAVLTT